VISGRYRTGSTSQCRIVLTETFCTHCPLPVRALGSITLAALSRAQNVLDLPPGFPPAQYPCHFENDAKWSLDRRELLHGFSGSDLLLVPPTLSLLFPSLASAPVSRKSLLYIIHMYVQCLQIPYSTTFIPLQLLVPWGALSSLTSLPLPHIRTQQVSRANSFLFP
jgi:hypothetical protein